VGFEGVSTYIDETLIQGILAGVLLLLVAYWIRFANNWLWRESFLNDGLYPRCVNSLGLIVEPLSSGPRLMANGKFEGREVELTMEGSFRGRRLICKIGDNAERLVLGGALNGAEKELEAWLSFQANGLGDSVSSESEMVCE